MSNEPERTETTTPATTGERPRHPLLDLRTEMDRLVDDFLSASWLPTSFGGRHAERTPLWPADTAFGGRAVPPVDVAEKDGAYEVTAELPGMEEKDIEVTLADGVLAIKGEKREEKEEKRTDYHLTERRFGAFRRSLRVPDGIEQDKIAATFKNGVLKVVLPKSPEAQRSQRKIAVAKG
jgi:HSP20 family protein